MSVIDMIEEVVPTLDAREAHQRAVAAGLIVRREDPLNSETPIRALIGGVAMPSARFYVRNHFPIPMLDPATWRLDVDGLVERPSNLSLRDLHRMPSESMVVTLECAGNGRSMFGPSVQGEAWGLGAVSTAEWTGVPLLEVLGRAGIEARARGVLFRGADRGTVPRRTGPVRFERGLKLADAMRSEALLAYAMNGEPLPPEHGAPLRLVVPGWYAVASVKWLTEITVIHEEFDGAFQTDAYVYERERDGHVETEPVTLQRVRALITEPEAGGNVERGDLAVRGVAWSGAGPIARVDVRVGDGPWRAARLLGQRSRYAWRRWELVTRIDGPGRTTLRARATDLSGRTQPEAPEWNRLGYGNNAVEEVSVIVR